MQPLTDTLTRLNETISVRRTADPEESYVARMFKKGRKKIAQKVGEEAVEVVIASVAESREALVKESADLLFHLLLLWNESGVKPEEIATELEKREGFSGIDEKKTSRALMMPQKELGMSVSTSVSYDPENIFAKILRGEIPATKVHEDDLLLAIHDIQPAAPVHVLVLPKGEYASFDDFCLKAAPEEIGAFFQGVQQLAAHLGLEVSGYRLITNHGAHASQTVPHFHVHLLGGRPLGGLVSEDKTHR